jgi:GMP synthase-like glutamine amidotransferase
LKPIIIFRHLACEGPGYLGQVLDSRSIEYRLVRIDAGDPVPDSIDGASALVFMGGPMSVNDSLPWVEAECRLIRAASRGGVPMLGHCLGGQLISKALGGTVGLNPVKEIGWFPVETVQTPETADWLRDIPARFMSFHWHGETFSLPPGASRLLRNDQCENQGFVHGNTLALQCHVEMTAEMVREWALVHREEVERGGEFVQSAEAMSDQVDAQVAASQGVADILYERWLDRVSGSR